MKVAIAAVVALIIGLFTGYYFGFDHGYDGAIAEFAPVEAGSEAGDAAEAMRELIGVWRSTEDSTFTREFRNDGVVIDAYEGTSPDNEGLWLVFTKDIPDASYKGPIESGAIYLSMAMSENERLYFKITRINAEKLELVFLDRGGGLSFDRMK